MPGVGKTRLAASSPKCLILRPPSDNTDSVDFGDADEWITRSWDEHWEAFDYMRHEGHKKYEWVWFDSISLWQDVGLDDLWETIVAEKPHRARHGLDQGDIYINMQRLARWTRHMAGMSSAGLFNFGITAHPRDLPEGEFDDADEKLMPYVQGKHMATKICGYMHIVSYHERSAKGTPVLRFSETKDYYAKDLLHVFSEPLFNPTVPKIMEAVEASRPKPRKKAAATPGKRRAVKRSTTTRR
jgi:hypothetical protein